MRNDIIDKVKRAVGKSAKKAAKISGDALDYTKMKFKLYDLHDKTELKYAELGRAVYSDDENADVEAICEEITALLEDESELKIKMNAFLNKKECSACGGMVDSKSDYCPLCGNRF